ncbi:DUF4065 domain-containing protein [Yersinia enterocolitica]|nr:DUF4065 domain-containing protein [Yersinia enterocolitica]
MFCEEKVAQMAAYLLLKRGGRMAYLKLMKLLYLANRQSLITFGHMMADDALYSLPHGPVMSNTLALMREKSGVSGKHWYRLLQTENHDLVLRDDPRNMDTDEVFDVLSRADIRILDDVYSKFGHMNRFELRDMTHLKTLCPEWHDPGHSRLPIDKKEILISVGKSKEEVENIIHAMNDAEKLKEFSSQLA